MFEGLVGEILHFSGRNSHFDKLLFIADFVFVNSLDNAISPDQFFLLTSVFVMIPKRIKEKSFGTFVIFELRAGA